MTRVLALLPRAPVGRLVGVVLLAAVIRIFFFTGFHGFDDVFYIRRAYALSQGHFALPTNHWAARVGLVGPTALAYLLFGVTLWSTVLFPFLCSILTVIVATVLGRRLLGDSAGWLAGLLVAMFPMDAIFASMLFPTAPVTLFCGVGFGAFLLAEAEGRSLLYFVAGVAFGLACVVHEAAAIVLVFYPVHVAASRRIQRGHLLALLGFGAALAIDPVVHALMGNARARLDVLSRSETAQGTATDVAYSGLNVHWIAEPFVRLLAERTFGLFSWLIAPLAVYRALRPTDARERTLSLILISVFLWTEFGTLSLHRYAPLARLPRYLCPLTLPAMWLLAKNLCEIRRPGGRRIVLVGLAATSLICLLLDSGNQLRPYLTIRAALASAHPTTVAVEKTDEFPLRFAEGMNPPYGLSPFGADVPATELAVSRTEAHRQLLQGTSGATPLATVDRPVTVYQRVLSSPLVLAVLRRLRPPERFAEYEQKVHSRESWTIYRLR